MRYGLDRNEVSTTKPESLYQGAETKYAHTVYLPQGSDDQNFFFGSNASQNPNTSVFKISYNSKHNGLLDITDNADISNIKTLGFGFAHRAIHFVNEDKQTLQDASGYTVLSPGEVIYDPKDKVWDIKKPIELQLEGSQQDQSVHKEVPQLIPQQEDYTHKTPQQRVS